MQEEWKDIKGFPGYQVSNYGRVRSHNKVTSSARYSHREWKNRILKQKVSTKDKCHRICLWDANGEHTFLVHRLEADAFLGEYPGMTVNHKDGNRHNNRIDNLEWLTIGDNIRHAFQTGLASQIPCTLIAESGERYNFRSMAEASRWLGRNTGYVSFARQKQRLTVSDISGKIYWLGEVSEDGE